MSALLTRTKSILKDIREAIAGSQQDFTQGSISRAVILLSIPMVLEMVMESIFAVVDIFFVAKLGPEAIATVGLTEAMLTILYAISVGLSMGVTAIIARRTGEKDPEAAAHSAFQSVIVGIILSLPIMLLGIFSADWLLEFMGASPRIISEYSSYTSIMIGGNIVIMLLFITNAIFRGAGDASVAMKVLWLANGINIILDPCLIFGWGPFPELGIKGAAIASVIGRGSGVLYQFYHLFNSSGRIQILKRHMNIQLSIIKTLLRLSLGGVGQFIIGTSSWVVLLRMLAQFGSDAVAGYTIAMRIWMFSLLPAWGMSNAAATLVGQNLGANEIHRAEKSVWISARINLIFLSTVSFCMILFAEPMVSIFTDEFELIKIGSQSIYVIAIGYVLYAYGMVIAQAFNGAGDTRTPTIINFICFWMLELPLAYFLAIHLKLQVTGIVMAILITECVLGVTCIVLFKYKTDLASYKELC